jgi:hypothetical protein
MKHLQTHYQPLFNSRILYNNGALSQDLDSHVWEVLGNLVWLQVVFLRHTIYRHVS